MRRGVVLVAGHDLGRPTTPPSGKGDDEKNNSFQSQSRLQQTSEIPTDLDSKAVALMRPLIVYLGLLLLLLTEIGCKKASAPQQAPVPVNVVTVIEKEVNEWDEFTGLLDPVESVEIRPRVSGYITEIHFEAGAIVKKGDLLYVIDPRPYQADFDRAAAEVDRMDAQLKLAEIELNRATELT